MTVAVDRSEAVAIVTLDRPDRLNAVDRAMVLEVVAAIDEADRDQSVKAIVVTGTGRAFCAGADLTHGAQTFAMDLPDSTIDDFRDFAGIASLRVFECTKPVIGAINGAAVGFGATFACSMDMRLANETTTFSFPFARRGMVPEGLSTWFLPRLVGNGRALEWAYTGRRVDATEALATGLVNRIVDGSVVDAAVELGAAIARENAPTSIAITRRLMWDGWLAQHPHDVHITESRATWARGRDRDVVEGIESFLEKRPADWD